MKDKPHSFRSNSVKLRMRIIILATTLILLSIVVVSQDASEIYRKAVKSTVTIQAEASLGSGFFIAHDIIVTNLHVVAESDYAYCIVDDSDRRYPVEGYLVFDVESDLILLKVRGISRPPLKISRFGAEPGQRIFVIGSPLGLMSTFSDGLVSGVRKLENLELIQITAPISAGNSGGPVINTEGEVVGICVGQIIEGQNLNFAISKTSLESLMQRTGYQVKKLTDLWLDVFYQVNRLEQSNQGSASNMGYRGSEKRPEIVDSNGHIFIIELGNTTPSITEKCYFYIIYGENPIRIGEGNITYISGNRCTIEMTELNRIINDYSGIYVLFESDLTD